MKTYEELSQTMADPNPVFDTSALKKKADELARQIKELNRCEWRADEDGIYTSSCDYTFVFETDGPVANGFEYCPKCGRVLHEVKEQADG